MRFRYLEDIQQEAQWRAVALEMDAKGKYGLVVWGGPRITCEVELAVILLVHGGYLSGPSHVCVLTSERTCTIFATRRRTRANTRLTSRDTVEGDGILYSGRPVFINTWKPRSATISKGRLHSHIHRTSSALVPCQECRGMCLFITHRVSYGRC